MEMLKWISLMFLFACVFILHAQADGDDDEMKGPQKTMTFGNVTVQIAGKSGKLKIWRDLPPKDRPDRDDEDERPENGTSPGDKPGKHPRRTPPIFVFLDELKEVDAEENRVGVGGRTRHSFNTFANQDFIFSAVDTGMIPNSNVTADFISFSGQLTGLTSTLKMTIYMVKQDGEIDINGEISEVKEGHVKFTFELESWEWCGCTKGQAEEVGEFVDLTLTVGAGGGGGGGGDDRKFKPKKRNQAPGGGRGKKPEVFDMGFGAKMDFSTQVKLDDMWTEMAENYPKFEERGNKNMFTFRFSRFNNTAFYDPGIDTGTVDEDGDGSDSTGGATVMASSLVMLVTALVLSIRQ